LNVFLNNLLIGELRQISGAMQFQYSTVAPQAISLSLPLQQNPYEHESCFPYFDGLLPEGDYLRQAIGKRFGVNARNAFSLLRAIGRECAGAVSLHEPGDDPPKEPIEEIAYRIISESELSKHIAELPERPLFADVDGIRLSLAGAQHKAAICSIEN